MTDTTRYSAPSAQAPVTDSRDAERQKRDVPRAARRPRVPVWMYGVWAQAR